MGNKMKYNHILHWESDPQRDHWIMGILEISEKTGELRQLEKTDAGAMFRTDIPPTDGFLSELYQSCPDIIFTHEFASDSMLGYTRYTYHGGCQTDVFKPGSVKESSRFAQMVWDQAAGVKDILPFIDKLEKRWQEFLRDAKEYSKDGRIDKVEDIATVKMIWKALSSPDLDKGTRAFLDRVVNPLEVVSESWYSKRDDDMNTAIGRVLLELRNQQTADEEYELEPKYRDQTQEQTM